MDIFTTVHDFIAQLLFSGGAPEWLTQIHQFFGWTA